MRILRDFWLMSLAGNDNVMVTVGDDGGQHGGWSICGGISQMSDSAKGEEGAIFECDQCWLGQCP